MDNEYIGTLTFDYNGADSNQVNYLMSALEHIGWEYQKTSSMIIVTEDVNVISLTHEILARAINAPGLLTMLNLHFKMVESDRTTSPGAMKPNRAFDYVLKKGLPARPPKTT